MRWTHNRHSSGRHLDRLVEDVEMRGYTIPAGFETDGISVRTWHRLLLTDYMQARWAALLHDYLLSRVGSRVTRRIGDASASFLVTVDLADDEFLAQMRDDGVGWWTRTVMYWAVRLYHAVK